MKQSWDYQQHQRVSLNETEIKSLFFSFLRNFSLKFDIFKGERQIRRDLVDAPCIEDYDGPCFGNDECCHHHCTHSFICMPPPLSPPLVTPS